MPCPCRVVLSCLAAQPPDTAGLTSSAPPAAARAALRTLTLEAVWRLLLAARTAGGQAQKGASAAGALKVGTAEFLTHRSGCH